MRVFIGFVLLSMLIVSCKDDKQALVSNQRVGYSISGTAENSNGYAYLQKYNEDNILAAIDSVSLGSGRFNFVGHVNNFEPYQVVVNENIYPVILENTVFKLEDNVLKGTKLQDDYMAYYEGLRKTDNAFVYQRNFINSHPESVLSLIVLKTMLGKTQWRVNQNKLAYKALDESLKQSYLGKEIHAFINAQEALFETDNKTVDVEVPKEQPKIIPVEKKKTVKAKTAKKRVSKPVKTERKPLTYSGINFEADDINGNNFELYKITTKSKYVLIDFWASWCLPCRKQNPYLVEVYNLYKDKGFDIVSVSEDRSKLAWQKAVKDDGLTWHHVIDDFNRLTKLYGIESIPHTILINRRGEIIASDISPYILKNRLAGLLR